MAIGQVGLTLFLISLHRSRNLDDLLVFVDVYSGYTFHHQPLDLRSFAISPSVSFRETIRTSLQNATFVWLDRGPGQDVPLITAMYAYPAAERIFIFSRETVHELSTERRFYLAHELGHACESTELSTVAVEGGCNLLLLWTVLTIRESLWLWLVLIISYKLLLALSRRGLRVQNEINADRFATRNLDAKSRRELAEDLESFPHMLNDPHLSAEHNSIRRESLLARLTGTDFSVDVPYLTVPGGPMIIAMAIAIAACFSAPESTFSNDWSWLWTVVGIAGICWILFLFAAGRLANREEQIRHVLGVPDVRVGR